MSLSEPEGYDLAMFLGAAQPLAAGAVRSLDLLLTGVVQADRSERTRSLLRDVLGAVPPAVQVRMLCPRWMTSWCPAPPEPAESASGGTGGGLDVRSTGPGHVPFGSVYGGRLLTLVVDGGTALVASGRGASVARDPEVVQSVCAFYETVWLVSPPAFRGPAFADPARGPLLRKVLGLLRAGLTDEVAARELSVSVRTFRRHVAEVMTHLDADSRFQAGVRAVELGLLPPEPPGRPASGSGLTDRPAPR